MNSAHYLFFFLLAIGILIVVHELGHYAAARCCGVKVLRFSLGFGPQILMRRLGADQTEWSLAAVPLGGYVKMLDEREGPVGAAERSRAFNVQSLARRSFIVAAGPLANLLLAVLIYWGVACTGTRDFAAVLGPVEAGSLAARAGLADGDRVTRFAGVEVRGWSDFRWQVIQHALDAEPVKLEVQRPGASVANLELAMQGVLIDEKAPDPLKQLGVSLPAALTTPVLGLPQAGSPAERAGFVDGDRVRKVDGHAVGSAAEFVKTIAASPGRTLSVQVERAGKLLTVDVRPESVAEKPLQGRIGIPVGMDREAIAESIITVRYGLVDGGVHAVRQTFSTAGFYLRAIWHIVKGNISWRNVSGPIAIADAAGQSAKAGADAYLGLIAALSVSLGVLNLLPVPILDGGHLLYYALERIRGRALSAAAEELSQRIGLVILVLLMSLAFFNDFHRVFFG